MVRIRLVRLTWRFMVILPDSCISVGITGLQLQDYKGNGGESGIRTHVTLSSKHAFQACAFSHSAISPAPCEAIVLILTVLRIARELQTPHFIRDDNSGDSLLLLA